MTAGPKKLIKTNKFLSLLSNGLAALFGIITYALLARSLTKQEFGIWVFFIAVFTFFDMLRAGLLSNAIIKKVAEAKTSERYKEIIGSGWKLNIYITVAAAFALTIILYAIAHFGDSPDYDYLFRWFGLLALLSMPHSMANWILNAQLRFDRILIVRLILQGGFMAGVILGYIYEWTLVEIIITYVFTNGISLLAVVFLGWSKHEYIGHSSKGTVREIFNFGKFSMGTLIGSNLLKSSDTFIIMSLLGPKSLAIYNVPEKLLGLIEIPLRALVSISFPQLAQKYAEDDKVEFVDHFETGSGFSTLLLLPVSILTLIFAEPLVLLLAGEEYLGSANILRVFAVYTALTPLDRYSGIALDVVNRPDLNLYKVLMMLTANIVGDIIVLQFTDDVVWVAFVSIITFATGIVAGLVLLKNYIPFRPALVFRKGVEEIKRLLKRVLRN